VSNSHNKTPQALPKWQEEAVNKVPKQNGRQFNGILIYIVWNLWKKRNKRVFENEHKTVQQVISLTKEDIMQRRRAVSFDG
jgi:hypothetical protein